MGIVRVSSLDDSLAVLPVSWECLLSDVTFAIVDPGSEALTCRFLLWLVEGFKYSHTLTGIAVLAVTGSQGVGLREWDGFLEEAATCTLEVIRSSC